MQRRALLLAALATPAIARAEPRLSQGEPPEMPGVRLVTLAEGLERPWALAFLPDGGILVTERPGRLRLIRDGALRREPLPGTPEVMAMGQGGLLDLALHPRFAENRLIYLTHSAGTESANRTVLTRARLNGDRLTDVQTLFAATPDKTRGAHFGSRLLWMADGSLLMSLGDGGNPAVQLAGRPIREQAQNLDAHLGKVLRLDENGRPPTDNPFLGRAGVRPEIWSFGHRNIQGMAWDQTRQMIFATEHGSRAGDELNRLRRGLNYGWPAATHSEEYTGGPISPHRAQPGLEDPLLVWMTTVAPSGLAAHSGRGVAAWRGDLFAGGLRSMDLRRVRLDAEGRVTAEERIPVGRRVRDVREGPDGRLYVLTDETNGRLMRVEPA